MEGRFPGGQLLLPAHYYFRRVPEQNKHIRAGQQMISPVHQANRDGKPHLSGLDCIGKILIGDKQSPARLKPPDYQPVIQPDIEEVIDKPEKIEYPSKQ